MAVFPLLDHYPLLGRSRVKMALDAPRYRHGHTPVWQMVALYMVCPRIFYTGDMQKTPYRLSRRIGEAYDGASC